MRRRCLPTSALCAGLALAGCGTSSATWARLFGTPVKESPRTASAEYKGSDAKASSSPAAPIDPGPAEPRDMSVTIRTRTIALPNVVPNIFEHLGACPSGTLRADNRSENFGELACRGTDGTLDGPYARNATAADEGDGSVIGLGERGQYLHGKRQGVWYRMRYGMQPLAYDMDTYSSGVLLRRAELVAHGSKLDHCLQLCEADRDHCAEQNTKCVPDLPCLEHDCVGDWRGCKSTCSNRIERPW